MSKIDYQALREAAEQAIHDDWGYDADIFHEQVTPSGVLALLDENERMCCNLIARNGEIEGLRRRAAELEKIATDYALKFQKAQDALKYAVLMRNKALSFEEAMQCTKEKYEGVIKKLAKNEHPVSPIPKPENDKFTVSIPDPKEYFINGVFQPLRYERDVEQAIIKAGGKVSWQETEDN
ncbi:ead/Ea22-like family protein [Escherichia coli]|uniref:ead/Ea22-like family protein n=1 Tax=Escherichia coli TaxID=562 RepID=UPI0003FCDBD7|nr:ead/Ea22-like family protein [Escherichia coli]EFA4193282.1 ead/Ea22-like family protein [Escherichia coli O96]EFH5804313.1 ead/Ea22-like family protein [Escherichia coli]EFJ3709974.1 ead/Ea22-like family protein [Escherichia coli]EGD7792396.1 ead/Ea22-like family protein [Escherichia coli]EGM7805752.1 ead/Ea22-like family protein [Escherichia coli]